MKQGMRRGVASLGLLFALASCTDLPVAPSRDTSGNPSNGASADPGTPPAPVVEVASLVLTPATVEINAPYSLGGYQSGTSAEPSEFEVAGYPTTAQLFVDFLAKSGEPAPEAELVWSTTNPALVMVDADGWIRSVDPGLSGMATVTAQLKSNRQIKASTTVMVRNDGKLVLELQ